MNKTGHISRMYSWGLGYDLGAWDSYFYYRGVDSVSVYIYTICKSRSTSLRPVSDIYWCPISTGSREGGVLLVGYYTILLEREREFLLRDYDTEVNF